jgi:predicted acyl esterase
VGDAVARLYAVTTGRDADWIVKLIDVYPEELLAAGTGHPGEVAEYIINLRDRSHRFRTGHRIMVQVQSSWFPLIDRNPQTRVPNIFFAKPEEFQKATHTLHVSVRYPTHILLPVR